MVRVLSFDVGVKNLALCELDVSPQGTFQVYKWTVNSCVSRGINVNKTPVADLAPTFYNYCRRHVGQWISEDSTIDRIFIENQPLGGRGAARNLKTKVLSHILQCILMEHCVALKKETPISFVHPGLKLKDMPRPADRKRTTYRENKLYAIHKTTEYVSGSSCQNPDVCQELYIDKKMKKDDLADAFLQGLLCGQMYARGDVIEAGEDRPKKVKQVKAAATAANESNDNVDSTAVDEETVQEPKASKKVKKSKIQDVVVNHNVESPQATEAAMEVSVTSLTASNTIEESSKTENSKKRKRNVVEDDNDSVDRQPKLKSPKVQADGQSSKKSSKK